MDPFSKELGFGKSKPEAINLLKKTIDILNEFEIDHMLISGTLLGFMRHNDFIPWDDDIDILVDSSILKKLGKIAEKYDDMNLFYKGKYDSIKICSESSKPIGDKEWDKSQIDGLTTKQRTLNFPYVDMFIYEMGCGTHICGETKKVSINGELKEIYLPFSGPCKSCFRFINQDTLVFFHNDWKKVDFFPTHKVDFLGIECNIPRNPERFLDKNFGKDWMTHIKSPEVNHKTNEILTTIIKQEYVRN